MKVLNVVGARPNFIKMASIMSEMKKRSFFKPILVHTGQHFDKNMSDIFFAQLSLPAPDISLNVGPATQITQTAKIMSEMEKVILQEKPDLVLVVGDVNSTFAAAFAAQRLNVKVAHVESGLRAYDWTMPEEVNRVLTDKISNYLFTTSLDAHDNLKREGITQGIYFVGNTMIDALLSFKDKAAELEIFKQIPFQTFCLMTFHRPENVDSKSSLDEIVKLINYTAQKVPIVFPLHPRTRKKLEEFGLDRKLTKENIVLIDPVGYFEFLSLQMNALFVVTDSGGVQEETTALQVPCLTIRHNTERPVTVTVGSNVLVGHDFEKYKSELEKITQGKYKLGAVPEKWDGQAAKRICEILESEFK